MTVLVGQSSTTGYTNGTAGNGLSGTRIIGAPFVASASGTATSLYIYVYNGQGSLPNIKLCIYNNSGTLLGSTGAITTNANGWVSGALGASVSITSGQTYYIGWYSDVGYLGYWTNLSTIYRSDTGSYTTPASSLSWTADGGIYAAAMYADGTVTPAGPTLSTISTSALKYLDTGITLTGSGFGASKGSSSVIISPTNNAADANAVTQTTTAWSDTSITFTVGRGALKYVSGTTYYVFVKTSGGNSSGLAVSLAPQTGWAFVDIVTPDTTAANRITATADITSGDQLAYGNIQGTGTVVVTSSATFNATSTVTAFDVEVNDGTGWGATATQTLSAGQPTYDGQDIIQVRSFTVRGRFT